MTLLSRLFRNAELSPAPPPLGRPRIAVFGDSHTAALQSAKEFPDRSHVYEHVRLYRVLKEKDGRAIGDTTLGKFCQVIRGYSASDFVFSAVGGNQYAVVSTVRSPVEYDFLTSPEDEDFAGEGAAIIPFRALAGHIEKGIRGTVGPVLREIRAATTARVFHLAPPPPKKDNEFIARHFESRFANQGIADLGPTRPELRLKCWKVQLDRLAKLCEELGVELVMPPWRAMTPDGYLGQRCYAKDVTHGNRRYGEYVLKDILEITGRVPPERIDTQ
jgi:hypothetical protein